MISGLIRVDAGIYSGYNQSMQKRIEKLQKLIDESSYIVALTGAGISTSAGIPDFRGEKGIYSLGLYDPYKTFDIGYFKRDPSYFFNFAREFLKLYEDIKPTEGHKFLAALEKKGRLKAVITQNIDGLHQMAGSKNVIELHGSFRTGHCLSCRKEYGFEWMRKILLEIGQIRCECGGIVKPDVVFFGEPVMGIDEAQRHSARADLFLVMGSSLTVQPASILPYLTSGKVVIINKGEVFFPEERAEIIINHEIDNVVRRLKW